MKKREKIICKCNNEMAYEGLEMVQMLDEDGDNPIISDLEVFICTNCENKIWIHKTENSEPVMAKCNSLYS